MGVLQDINSHRTEMGVLIDKIAIGQRYECYRTK